MRKMHEAPKEWLWEILSQPCNSPVWEDYFLPAAASASTCRLYIWQSDVQHSSASWEKRAPVLIASWKTILMDCVVYVEGPQHIPNWCSYISNLWTGALLLSSTAAAMTFPYQLEATETSEGGGISSSVALLRHYSRTMKKTTPGHEEYLQAPSKGWQIWLHFLSKLRLLTVVVFLHFLEFNLRSRSSFRRPWQARFGSSWETL